MLKGFNVIDLTQTLSEATPTWNGSCGFHVEVKQDYDKMFRIQQLKLHAGIGTHIDAPCHLFSHGVDVADLSLDDLTAPLAVIDISSKANACYEMQEADIYEHEEKFGVIASGTFVMVYTGWGLYFHDAERYRNEASLGKMSFPAVSKAAAKILLDRDICGIGIDTLSPDCSDVTYPVHHLLLGRGKYIVENMAFSNDIPKTGAYVVVLPLKAKRCAEAPCRVIALVPQDS